MSIQLGQGNAVSLPQPPKFDRVEDERLHRKQRLAAALRLFAYYGFDEENPCI
jgi:hypothetical protein